MFAFLALPAKSTALAAYLGTDCVCCGSQGASYTVRVGLSMATGGSNSRWTSPLEKHLEARSRGVQRNSCSPKGQRKRFAGRYAAVSGNWAGVAFFNGQSPET